MRTLLLMGLMLCVLGTPTSLVLGGTIRHDVDDALYIALSNQTQYQPVGQVYIDDGVNAWVGSGTLINDRYILTAAHVIDKVGASTLMFRDHTDTWHAASVSSIIIHPNWISSGGNLFEPGDIALFMLNNPVAITPAILYDGTGEVGQVGTMVGYGRTGDGETGMTDPAGTRRAGNNMIDAIGGDTFGSFSYAGIDDSIILSDFDDPLGRYTNKMGDSNPLPLEYSIASGDSGGGTFIEIDGQHYLAGVHSFGASFGGPPHAPDADNNATYGTFFGSARVSSYIPWITANVTSGSALMFSSMNSPAVPEPASLSVVALVALLLQSTHRRRRHDVR